MPLRTEYQILADEREQVGKRLSARGIAFRRWFRDLDPPNPTQHPEPDHFVWRDVGELFRGPGR